MHLEDMNWMQAEAYLEHDDRLLLVTGACEQHGYLSLLTDIKIPLAMAEAASRRTGVLVAPPLNFGISPSFARYPGTISLRTRTFLAVVDDIVRWLHQQGFRRLLFVNGHGGNSPALALLHELVNDLPGLKATWYNWWLAPSVMAITEEIGRKGYHGGWYEAFPDCRVADLPLGEKAAPAATRILNADEWRALYGDGIMGGGYVPDDAVLQRIFDAAVADIVARLTFD